MVECCICESKSFPFYVGEDRSCGDPEILAVCEHCVEREGLDTVKAEIVRNGAWVQASEEYESKVYTSLWRL